jgi:hypothetical protein
VPLGGDVDDRRGSSDNLEMGEGNREDNDEDDPKSPERKTS